MRTSSSPARWNVEVIVHSVGPYWLITCTWRAQRLVHRSHHAWREYFA